MTKPKFETMKEYFEWQKERNEFLKEFYQPVFDAFQKLADKAWAIQPESSQWSWIKDAEWKFEEYLMHTSLEQMWALPGIDEVSDKEEKDFIWRGGAQSAIGYREYDSPSSTRIIQKDKNGEILFEEIIDK